MIDTERKNSILDAEREFERKENLARALAESGVILVGKVTSRPNTEDPAGDALHD